LTHLTFSSVQSVALARNAMNTRFEIVLHGDSEVALRGAGEEALDEVERLDAQLSLYRPTSEIARLNARAASQWVRVTPALFHLLQHARQLSQETAGAFDITIAPLIRCWGFMGGTGAMPEPESLAEARNKVGMNLVLLDEKNLSVRFERDGVMLDLGAIGKGYAIERAAEILREAGVDSALLHGGTSTIYALGQPPTADTWRVGIDRPPENDEGPPASLAIVPLKDEAMSVSAVWGKSFQVESKTYGHVIDPRIGEPASNAMLAAVVLPSATETDALSTALLTVGVAGHGSIANLRPAMRTVLMVAEEKGWRAETKGINLLAAQGTTGARDQRIEKGR
jgi:thiamine biosynthesis lipoprotein